MWCLLLHARHSDAGWLMKLLNANKVWQHFCTTEMAVACAQLKTANAGSLAVPVAQKRHAKANWSHGSLAATVH
jgi:hypothetical protein